MTEHRAPLLNHHNDPACIGSVCAPVAVIISVYRNDSAARFAAALDSMIGQVGLKPGTVRIYLGVDGPVSADVQAVIAAKRPHLYKVIETAENRGLHFILSDLIAALENELFIFRMDADDVSHPERVIRQLAYLNSHPDVDVVGTAIREVHTDGRLFHVPANSAVGPRDFYRRMPVAHPTVCFRRYVIDDIGGYPKVALNEDVAMWIECLQRGYKFGNLNEYLLDFTIDDSFWKRRSYHRAFSEFRTHSRGIWRLEGITWKYVVPFMRMVFKLMPEAVRRWGYTSGAFRKASADKL